jgi:predicted aspartyl protease
MRRVRIFLALLLFPVLLQAQEDFIRPPAKLLTRFKFRQMSGGVILMQGQLNDFSDTLNFMLDTGSAGISLDSATRERLGLPETSSNRTIRGIAGIRNVTFAMNNTLRLPGLVVDSLNFHIGNYELLSDFYGERIDGIVGYTFLSRFIVAIDFDSTMLSVYTKGTYRYPRGGHLLRPTFTNLPIQEFSLKDQRALDARFYFDTGASLCFLLSQDFVNDSAILNPRRKIYTTKAEGFGGKREMRVTVMKEVKLGPFRFRNVPVHIFDDEFNVTDYPYLGGLVGNDLLRRFNMVINYDQREIHLLPNTHFRDAFDYAYTGLGIYWVEGDIRVVDVMPGSPADKAGLKKDDIIVAVDNNVSRNIQVYKDLLETANAQIHIVIQREGKLRSVYMKVKSIL